MKPPIDGSVLPQNELDARRMLRLGKSDAEIVASIGISRRTLQRYRQRAGLQRRPGRPKAGGEG